MLRSISSGSSTTVLTYMMLLIIGVVIRFSWSSLGKPAGRMAFGLLGGPLILGALVLIWTGYGEYHAIRVSSDAVEILYPWPKSSVRVEASDLATARVVMNHWSPGRERWFLEIRQGSGPVHHSAPIVHREPVLSAAGQIQEQLGKSTRYGVRTGGRFGSVREATEQEVRLR